MLNNQVTLLNRGSDGLVYSFQKDKVIKVINLEKFNLLEIEILTLLDCIYISKAIKIIIEDYKIKIFQDRAVCDLNNWININKQKKYFSIEKRLKYIRQIVHAVDYLFSKNILHGDLKPSNILLYNDILKLNDFSMSRKLDSVKFNQNRKLYTLGYRPPECVNNKYHQNSDIWALGCTIYEIYYGKKYFKFDNSGTQYHLKDLEENKLENNFINKIIKKTIVKDPDKRISIKELKSYFN